MKSKVGRFPLTKWAYHSCLRPFLPNLAFISLEIEDIEIQLWVPKHDAMFSELYFQGNHEEWVTKKLRSVTCEGMTVVDVGASFGYHTIFAAKLVGRRGKVFAFEPNPLLYKLLQKNIELNQLNNVIPIQKAVSNKVETTRLWLAANLGAGNILNRRDRKEFIVVESTSLDKYFNNLTVFPQIDVLKMDVEGAEIMVIKGMKQSMTRNENLKMVIEFHPHRIVASGNSCKEFWAELRQNGFWPISLLEKNGHSIELNDLSLLVKIENGEHPVHLFVEKKI